MQNMLIIKLADAEIKELSQHPRALQVLIDYHTRQEVEGGAMGYDVSHHADRIAKLREIKAKNLAELEMDELDDFLAQYENIKRKATAARNIYQEITKQKGCRDTFSIEDGWAYWRGQFNTACSCHPVYDNGEFSMSLDELLPLDLDVYRLNLTNQAKRVQEKAAELAAEQERKAQAVREQRERAEFERLQKLYGGENVT